MRFTVYLGVVAATLTFSEITTVNAVYVSNSNALGSFPRELSASEIDALALAQSDSDTVTELESLVEDDDPKTKDGKKDAKSEDGKKDAKSEDKKKKESDDDNTLSGEKLLKKHLKGVSADLKEALDKIPYMKEIVMTGELAKLAFDYMYDHAPMYIKQEGRTGWNVAILGRFKAFKQFMTKSWTGKSSLRLAVDDYMDFLSLEPDNERVGISFSQFFDNTRAVEGRGTYDGYSEVMKRYGSAPERKNFISTRQAARNAVLAKELASTRRAIEKLEDRLSDELISNKKLEFEDKSVSTPPKLDLQKLLSLKNCGYSFVVIDLRP